MSEPVNEHEGVAESETSPPSMPRWVKISGLAALVLAVVLVIIMLLVGGEHGPGLHTGAAESAGASMFSGGRAPL